LHSIDLSPCVWF